jgi:D-arabinitol 4-dehydrogenase
MTRIVSFTVTEAGYYLDSQGRLDLASPMSQQNSHAARGEGQSRQHDLRSARGDPARAQGKPGRAR